MSYEIILADPPWQYDFSKSKSRKVENQYPTMNLNDICAIGTVYEWRKEVVAPNAVLYLWATAPKLPDALLVMECWDFTYKTNIVWDKVKRGMGYWARGRHEHLLIGTRGKAKPPAPSLRQSSVLVEKRGKHSRKPVGIHEMIERQFPDARKLELFARSQRPGWDVWGNEVESTVTLRSA